MIWVIDAATMARYECDTEEGARAYARVIELVGHKPWVVVL